MDELIKKIEKLFEKVVEVEEIARNNNHLIGFMLSGSPKSISLDGHRVKSMFLSSEMLEYLQENDISIDFLGDA